MQNEWAGAQAFSSFDTYLAPFVKVDNLSYEQVKKSLESFIYGVNTPSRWGTQAPFSNITLDWVVPNDMAEMNAIVGGKEMDFKYKDCKKEMDMINKAFLEIMIEGDANGRGFQYPIPTYSITSDFDWSETENNRLLFEMTSKYGTPYFSNYINSDMEPSDVRSMCCRLRLDLRELRKKSGGFFGSGESTGSVGVVTINMPRIAYEAADEADFYRRLDKMMDISARSLKSKRTIITRLLDEGLYPYTKRYLGNFDSHFSTIGLVGMNEACLNANWIGEDLTHEKAQKFTQDVLNHMRERLSDYQEMYGDLYNLEATPAESTSYRLAKHDVKRYPDIITASEPNDTPYYTNSSHLPVGYTEDIFAALDIQDELQTLYTSGTVFHAFLGEKLPDWQSAAQLVRKIAENYKLPYYTLSPTYSICKEHGYISGEVYSCPICNAKTEVYSRITGYYRPVQNWNDGKSKEFKDRKVYNIANSVLKRVSDAGEKQELINLDAVTETPADTVLLFTTQTCPNCKIAETFLQKANVPYQKVVAEENASLVQQYSIMKAPTLIVQHGDQITKFDNASDIRRYSDSVTK
ncbi:MAG: ribonucleoside triphosphate reductase, partial [Peptococcaceae bacterium]|nr:ribonucleoside triphosphate reductase [Peptococcaceae bacterium]